MAYRLRYQFNVDWAGPGAGPMTALASSNPGGPTLPDGGASGQTMGFTNAGSGVISPTFTGTDVTNLTTAAQTDMAAQLNAVLATIQAWAQGQP